MPAAFPGPRVHGGLAASAALVLLAACGSGTRAPASGDSALATSAPAAASPDVEPTPRSAGDYGPDADVAALRAAWKNESAGHDTIPQIVAVGDYGVVEVRNGGRNSPFLVLFKRDDAGQWQSQGLQPGPVATCWFTSQLVPHDVAAQLVAHDTRLAAVERTDPQAGCPGGR
jgi:hypothetical protein